MNDEIVLTIWKKVLCLETCFNHFARKIKFSFLPRWVAVYDYFELLLSCLVIWENAHRCIFGIQSAAYLIWHFQCHIIIVCQMSPHCLHIAFTWYVINIFCEIGYTMILHLYCHEYIEIEKNLSIHVYWYSYIKSSFISKGVNLSP